MNPDGQLFALVGSHEASSGPASFPTPAPNENALASGEPLAMTGMVSGDVAAAPPAAQAASNDARTK